MGSTRILRESLGLLRPVFVGTAGEDRVLGQSLGNVGADLPIRVGTRHWQGRVCGLDEVVGQIAADDGRALHAEGVWMPWNTGQRVYVPGLWDTGGVERSVYAQTRPYAVVDDLAELAGPGTGVVEVPLRLDWSGPRRYDLTRDQDRRLLYETILNQAVDPQDLRTLLNADVLRGVWGHLWLPTRIRQLWESRFPALAIARAA